MGKIIGDFRELEEMVACGDMSTDEYQKIFEKARVHGLDDSVYPFAVGGSDAPIINGMSKFKTPLRLYREKMGIYVEPNSKESELIFFKGHIFEGPFRELFTKVTGIKTYPYYKQTVHDEYPHCVANIDGLAVINNELWIYEGKTSQNPKTQNAFWKGKVPSDYMIQVQFYMSVLDRLTAEELEEVDPSLSSILSDYEIKGAVVNCGWGIADRDMHWSFVKRDKEFGDDICDICESFVLDAEKGIPPSNEEVLDVRVIYNDAYANYGPVDEKKEPVKLNNKYETIIKEAMALDEEIESYKKLLEKKKEAIKPIEEEFSEVNDAKKTAEERRKEILAPLVDEIKEGTTARIEINGENYEVSYDVPKNPSFGKDAKSMMKTKYPEAYEETMSYQKTISRKGFTINKR